VKEYVLDANAVLRYFGVSEGQGANKVRALFEQAERGQARLSMSVVNLGEVLYVLLKHVGEPRARHYIQVLQHVVTMVEADVAQALGAAEIKHRYKLGYAESFAAMLAVTLKATLVSADPSFEKLGNTLKWVRLPKYEPA
jgi:predicted nucleic acid-binding protein